MTSTAVVGKAIYQTEVDRTGLRNGLAEAERDMTSSLGKAAGTMQSIGKSMSATGMSMTRNLTLPILAAGTAIFKVGSDFESALNQIVGLTGVTRGEIEGVRQGILSLAGEVGKTPQELAEAFYFLASAGFDAEKAMVVLDTAARASATGLGTTQDIAKVLGLVINAYGEENIDAARAADILTAAVGAGTVEADAFAGVLGRVVPTAALLGVEFEEVTAALAGMSLTGLRAEEAATSLNQVLVSLLKPTQQAEEALAGMGLSSEGLRKQLREEGLLSVLQTLEERFGGNEAAAAQVFGNVRALRGVLSLLGLDSEQLAGVFEDVNNSTGRMATGFAETEGPARDADRAIAEMNVLLIELARDVMPVAVEFLRGLAEGARNLAEWWSKLDEGTKRLIIQILGVTAVIGPVLLIVGKLISGFGFVLGAVDKAAGAFLRLGGSMSGMGANASAAQASLALLLSPIGLVVAGIGAAIFAFMDWQAAIERGTEKGREAVQALAELEGGFRTQEEAARAAERAAVEIELGHHQRRMERSQDLIQIIPILGNLKTAWNEFTDQQETAAAVTATNEEAQRILAETLRQDLTDSLDAYIVNLDRMVATMRELPPDFEMTEAAAAALASQFGVTAEEVRAHWDMVREDFATNAAAIRAFLATLPPDFEMTEEAAQELALVIGVSVDEIKQAFAELPEAVIDPLELMRSTLLSLGPDFELTEQFAQLLATQLGLSAADISATWSTLQQEWSESNAAIVADLQSLPPNFEMTKDAAAALATVLGHTAEDIEAAWKGMQQAAQEWATAQQQASQDASQAIEEARGRIKGAIDGITDAMSALGTSGEATNYWKEFKDGAQDNLPDVEERIEQLRQQIRKLDEEDLTKLGPNSLATWITMRTGAQDELGALEVFVDNHGEIIANILPDHIANAETPLANAINDYVNIPETALELLRQQAVSDAAETAASHPDAFRRAASQLGIDVNNYTQLPKDKLEALNTRANQLANDTSSALPDALRQKQPTLVRAVDGYSDVVRTGLSGLPALAYRSGAGTTGSLIDGINSKYQSLVRTVNGVAQVIKSGFKLDSPAKSGPWSEAGGPYAWMQRAGRGMSRELGQAMLGQVAFLQSASERVAEAATPQLGPLLNEAMQPAVMPTLGPPSFAPAYGFHGLTPPAMGDGGGLSVVVNVQGDVFADDAKYAQLGERIVDAISIRTRG